MYPVDQDLYNQTKADVQVPHLRGWIEDTIAFTENNILRDTFSINAQCTESTKISIGTVYTKTLKMTLCHGVANYRRQWKGKKIVIEQGIEIPRLNDTPVVKWIPMGTFYASEGVWTPKGINIKAYDVMMRFDKALDVTQVTGVPFDLIKYMCDKCGVTFGMTRAEVELLPNGAKLIGIDEINKTPTFRDELAQVCVALGGFAEIYRDGKLYIRNYHTVADDAITIYERFNPSFSDFTSYFSAISIVNTSTGYTSTYNCMGAQPGGLTMELNNTTFLQLGTFDFVEAMRQEVANAVGSISYTPFNATVLTSFYYDLSDVLSFPAGIADDCTGCVMSITYTFTKTKLVSYGDDPAMQVTKTAVDKAINAASRSGKDQTIIHVYENEHDISIGNGTREKVVEIEFATIKPTRVLTLTEINADLTITDPTGIATATVYYYLNNELQGYQPVGTWNNDGKHIISLMYPLTSTASNVAYTWDVYLKIDGGSATIDTGDVHAVLEGQGLVALDQFDGLLTLTDTYTAVDADKDFMEWLENVNVTQTSWNDIALSEVFTDLATDKDFATWSESVAIDFFLGPWEPMITEDDYDLLTEDGDQFYTEGEIV